MLDKVGFGHHCIRNTEFRLYFNAILIKILRDLGTTAEKYNLKIITNNLINSYLHKTNKEKQLVWIHTLSCTHTCGTWEISVQKDLIFQKACAQIHHTPHWPHWSRWRGRFRRGMRGMWLWHVACGTLGAHTACHRRQLSCCCCPFLCTIGDVDRRVTFWPIYSRKHFVLLIEMQPRQGKGH